MGRLGNNPLFDAEKEREELGIVLPEKKAGRPRKDDIIRDKGTKQGLTPGWTRATFIIRDDLLETLKNYAYTERITVKEALEDALDDFLGSQKGIMDRNKPREKHKKGAQNDKNK